MGSLLSYWKTSKDIYQGIIEGYVDFECDDPTEKDMEVWCRVNDATSKMRGVLEYMEKYPGAQEQISLAIGSPEDLKMQEETWDAVSPLVENLKNFYTFSIELQNIVKELLTVLCSDEISQRDHLIHEQALFKQLADILHFTLMFDQIKLNTPSIQNDISYYRRKFPIQEDDFPPSPIQIMSREMSTEVSFFYASPSPFLLALANTTLKFVDENPGLPLDKTTDCLSTMAHVCRIMIDTPEYREQFASEDTQTFCLRVMVASIILFDHIEPKGAFVKTSPINIKSTIKTLRSQRGGDKLMNTLRYTTKHLNDDLTPKTVRALFT